MHNIGQYSNFKTHNLAKKFTNFDNIDKLDKVQNILQNTNNFAIIGGGTNILFSQSKYENKHFIKMDLTGFEKIEKETYKLSTGQNLTKFIDHLVKSDIHTLDPLYGLPGSIGGAVIGNAGSFGLEIGQFVETVKYLTPDGEYKTTDNYKYEYRSSNFKNTNKIITEIILKVPDQKIDNQKSLEWYQNRRQENQAFKNTCGCFWKNPKIDKTDPDNSKILDKLQNYENNPLTRDINQDSDMVTVATGRMTDTLGLKGYSQNGVKISEDHGNFVINFGTDNSKDILNFAQKIENKVYDEFNIQLEKEVQII